MIEYKTTGGQGALFEEPLQPSNQSEGKISLTKLWEVVVRTKRLPEDFDAEILFHVLRDRLRDPEKEVRQNAMRVLSDLIPVTPEKLLDNFMKILIPELLNNLGHHSPALRKSSIDTLRVYLKHSSHYDEMLKTLLLNQEENVLFAAPFLISIENRDCTLKEIVDQLWENTGNTDYQEERAVRALARMRYALGDDRFKRVIGDKIKRLEELCDAYGLPIILNETIEDGERLLWKGDEIIQDRVILETEITLKTGPAITMQIHEESRPSSVLDGADDQRIEKAVIRVLPDDNENEYYEEVKRTPRKVRFGGESVKMRTPESDSSNQTDENDNSTIKITVKNAISIKTRKSLIPVRITSLPSTPKKKLVEEKKRMAKSTPNLSVRSKSLSKIPLRNSMDKPERKQEGDLASEPKKTFLQPPKIEKITEMRSSPTHSAISRSCRARSDSVSEPATSPLPPHREVEVLHNLMRSPERKRKASIQVPMIENKEENQEKTYSSFTVCTESKEERQIVQSVKSPEVKSKVEVVPQQEVGQLQYDSFQVCEENVANEKEVPVQKNQLEPKKTNYLHESLTLSSFSGDDELWAKSEALENLLKMLKEPNICESLEPGPAALLFEALFACRERDKLHSLADDALLLIVDKIRTDVLEQCLGRLAAGTCKMGSPAGVKLALAITKKCSPKTLQLTIIKNCFGHRSREGALQILMAISRLLPSSEVEITKITEFAAQALRDRRRRVRHAALETLASLAQISSPPDIIKIVTNCIQSVPDYQHLMRVIRTRLSRRQLPIAEVDGTIRYSTPRDQTEVEWLSGVNIQQNFGLSSPPSSTSSSAASINYWRHNLRHEERSEAGNAICYPNTFSDEGSDGNRQIWAVDTNVFGAKTAKSLKENNKIVAGTAHHSAVLRPVYILQPEESAPAKGRGHRRYDRGRSFSPPKGRNSLTGGRPQDIPNVSFAPPSPITGPEQQSTNSSGLPKTFKYHEGFRKSFSTDTLYYNERLGQQEPASLSSRSSTTSTGSSNKSGNWHKDFKSGIPVPVSCKFRIRTSNTCISSMASGPVIARRSAISSPLQTPVIEKSTPNEVQTMTIPPRSSGSESSGYFTPPDSQRAFVKLDTEERISEAEEVANNNHVDCVDSYTDGSFPPIVQNLENSVRAFSPSSAETSDGGVEETSIRKQYSVESIDSNNVLHERTESRFSSGSQKRQSFSEITPITIDSNRNKSKSVVELQNNFLPEISNVRKLSSAPPLNDEAANITNNNLASNFDEAPISPSKTVTVLPGSMELVEENIVEHSVETSENVTTVRLTRRFQRTQSRKSIKATPRSQKETAPAILRPFSKPKEALQHVLTQMESGEWETVVQGLQGLMRVTRNHPEIIDTQMHNVCVTLSKHVKNLRSQVARVACKTASELFVSCKKGLLEMEFEEIAAPLLQRTADTNKFLRADANAALDVMSEHMPNNRVVAAVTTRGCVHQNAIVRAAAVRILTDIVKRHGPDKVMQMPKDVKDKILLAGANSLADGSQEARGHGKVMFALLKTHPGFHRALLEAVPQNVLRHISKSLNSIKAGA